MNPSRIPVRWRFVLGLGFSLAALYIGGMLWLSADQENGPMNFDRPDDSPVAATPLRMSEPSVRQAITRVIASQLAAFRQEDYHAAYKYASSGLQTQMPLPAFEKMVRNNYGAMPKSRSEEFGLILDNGQEALVNVEVISESGHHVHYQYLMLQEKTGWRIGGVKSVVTKSTLV